MLLFKKVFWEGLTSGAITLTFRRWQKAKVRTGGRYRCHPIGVLEVDEVTTVVVSSITADDAKRAGFASRDELLGYLCELGPVEPTTTVYRVQLRYGGDGDRVGNALEDQLSADDVKEIRNVLARFDKASTWTMRTLMLITRKPRTRAAELAATIGQDTLSFKANVVKLKKLGLTQSFEVGYEITPRGLAYLNSLPKGKRTAKE